MQAPAAVLVRKLKSKEASSYRSPPAPFRRGLLLALLMGLAALKDGAHLRLFGRSGASGVAVWLGRGSRR